MNVSNYKKNQGKKGVFLSQKINLLKVMKKVCDTLYLIKLFDHSLLLKSI